MRCLTSNLSFVMLDMVVLQMCLMVNKKEITMLLSRQEMIGKLEWNRGGYGFGICSVASSMLWAMDAPGPGKPDLKCIVAVSGSPEKYTDEELAKIVVFSERVTAKYDTMFRYRRGANLILLDKSSDLNSEIKWMRKRLTWTQGPMWSDTLDEAISVMER